MDNNDEETTYQYFTIKNDREEEGFAGLHDILDMEPEESEADNKAVFYLTFNQETEVKDLGDNDSKEPVALNNDVKLITLEDGRMFMTTGENLESLASSLVLPEPLEETEPNDTCQLSNEEDEDSDANYQLIQLTDGTQAVIKVYKIDETISKDEEPPKKTKRFQCFYEGCNKVYATSYHLTVHMRSHTDCRPYECTVEGCEKKFSTSYSLKAHIRTHTGEKPYACTVCTKQFKTSGDLQKHTRIHTGEKPFMCPIEGCSKSFTTSNIRKVHIRSHTGERPFSCDHPNCGKAFSSLTNYKNHLRIHSGEKPFVCPVEGCGKRFTEYSSLYKHNAVHQPIRPYVCVFCEQKFKQETALNFHKRLKHNVVITKDGTEIMVKFE